MEVISKTIQDNTDPDFIWDEYLEETNSVAAPPEAFTHVEYSLESVFKVGMKLEIPNSDEENCYWIASVVMTCGDLLSLRYAGFNDDRSKDFWFNIKSGEFHPVGWCSANNKKLYPPRTVLEKHSNIDYLLQDELKKVESIPASLSEDLNAGVIPIDQIKCGMKVEVCEELDPLKVWIATILQNVGGRLLLRYDGMEDSSLDFWLFYLSDRISAVDSFGDNVKYSAPKAVKEKYSKKDWDAVLMQSVEGCKEQPFPAHVLEPKLPLEEHTFKKGMKLEAVDPANHVDICPATVADVINEYYFVITIDSYAMDDSLGSIMCCNTNTQTIFPVKWAQNSELDLKAPKGYDLKDAKFSWDEYLKHCRAEAAPEECFNRCLLETSFENGMKLEAVDPLYPCKIYVATINKVIDSIMLIQLDSDDETSERKIITGINSFDIYPVGWCASNSYPLQTPVYRSKSKTVSLEADNNNTVSVPMEIKVSPQPEQHGGKSWCPKIYFNHRCFTGPLLSKSRLAELPKAIGPGAVHLVMREVLTRVVNIAYKSSRVLQILQMRGKPSPDMMQLVIKAKYKDKSYKAVIEVIRYSDQVEEFCKGVCTLLECCPHLFGPKLVEDKCPSNCHTQTKTKFGYNFVKKHKKPGRPPLVQSTTDGSGEILKRGPGRKKKRKHWTQLLAAAENSHKENIAKQADSNSTEEDTPNCEEIKAEESGEVSLKENSGKKKLKHIPSSSIVTRGAKLPNFGLWHHVTSFHSKRGRPRTRPLRPFPPRKVGRPVGSTKKVVVPKESDDEEKDVEIIKLEEEVPAPKQSVLKSNPLDWSVEEVVKYIQETDCAPIAPLLKEQEIDGQALLMLNIFNVQQYLHLKPEPAKKFCYLIKMLKIEFFTHFV